MKWEPVIGLEVHVQLKTQSKIFSHSSTSFGASPNTHISGIDIGLPGTLPLFNAETIEMALRFGIAIQATIPPFSIFERKHYFYPDLPKGYQISQNAYPIVGNGMLEVPIPNAEPIQVPIIRAHLEEDAGKLLHDGNPGFSGVDLNRAGTPLLEIVSSPALRSPQEAVAYLKTLHTLVCYLDICDGNLQEGSFRCDANISVRPKGSSKLGVRCELKNLNSFKFIEKALTFEIEHQILCLERGEHLTQETKAYDPTKNKTVSLREKGSANDYRYFPDPDLRPVFVSEQLIASIKKSIPELPADKRSRFISDYGLNAYDTHVLTQSKALADCFESIVQRLGISHAKLVSNWLSGDFLSALHTHQHKVEENPMSLERWITLFERLLDGTLSSKTAKQLFELLYADPLLDPEEAIIQYQLRALTDGKEISNIIQAVFERNAVHVKAYREGKIKLFGFFVGEVMKLSGGTADPKQLNILLKEALSDEDKHHLN